jgi:hypothetical protein
MTIIINTYTCILYLLISGIVLIQIIEDIYHQEIYFSLTLIEIILFLLIDLNYLKLVGIYIIVSFIYYLFYNFLKNHLGFGDLWYLLLYFYMGGNISLKFSILYKVFFIFIIICFLFKIKRIAFLPIIGLGYLLLYIAC